ncbi:MAG: hypothetical protein P4L55_02065 [Syntrophobacteraceae bacterium]|nr:hypothetical protein [Syntrophobacteraceae bacterium]
MPCSRREKSIVAYHEAGHAVVAFNVPNGDPVNDVSTGAANDLQQATDLVRSMITEFGMSDNLGLAAYNQARQAPFPQAGMQDRGLEYSQETAKLIDAEVSRMLSESYATTNKILSRERHYLEIVAQALLEKETLTGEELRSLMESKVNKAA